MTTVTVHTRIYANLSRNILDNEDTLIVERVVTRFKADISCYINKITCNRSTTILLDIG